MKAKGKAGLRRGPGYGVCSGGTAAPNNRPRAPGLIQSPGGAWQDLSPSAHSREGGNPAAAVPRPLQSPRHARARPGHLVPRARDCRVKPGNDVEEEFGRRWMRPIGGNIASNPAWMGCMGPVKSGTRVCSGGTAELHTKAACSGLDPEPRGRLARPLCLRSFPRKRDSASRGARPCPRRADPRLRGEERPGRAREGIGISSADSILLFSLLREFRAHFLHALRNGRILAPIPFHAGACLDPTRAHAEGERRLHGPSSGRIIGEDVDRRSRTTAGPW